MSFSPQLKHIFYNEPLPNGWSIKSVDSIKSPEKYSCVAGPFGSSISSKYFVDEGVPVIRGGNLSVGQEQFIAKDFVFVSEDKARTFPGQHVKAGDLVFTCWGTLGQVGLIPKNGPFDEYIISNKQLKLRPDPKKCNSKFLYYYFSLPQMVQHINDIAIGSAVPGINLGLLKGIKVVMPPKEQQNKIAAILSAYDDLVENNKRRIALLEKMAEEIYREWFVRFRFPGYQDAEFEKGIPKGWGEIKFGEFCTLKRGYDLPDSLVVAGEYPVIASTSVKTYHNQYKVKPPVVTTGRSGSLGTVLISHKSSWPLNTTLYVKDYRGNNPYLVFYTLKGMQLEQFNAGAGVPSLNRNHLNGLKLAKPPKEIQSQFNSLIEQIFQQIWKLEQSMELLVTIKNLLLPRLISGKLSVEDLDIEFPPSMQEVV